MEREDLAELSQRVRTLTEESGGSLEIDLGVGAGHRIGVSVQSLNEDDAHLSRVILFGDLHEPLGRNLEEIVDRVSGTKSAGAGALREALESARSRRPRRASGWRRRRVREHGGAAGACVADADGDR